MVALAVDDQTMEALGGYVRYLADQMRLRDWEFEISYDDDLGNSLATIHLAACKREGMICLAPKFFGAGPEEQRYALVHELVHPHLQPLRDTVGTVEAVLLSTWPVVRASHDNALENACHNIAAMHAPYVPTFPQWHERNCARLAPHGGGVPEPQRGRRGDVPSRQRRR